MTRLVSVHGLIADGDATFRYIGVTTGALRIRFNRHVYEARYGIDSHKCRWLRKCLAEGRAVKIKEIIKVPFAEWPQWEQSFIARIPNLTNSTAGGRGALDWSPELRAKISAQRKGRRKGIPRPAHVIAAVRAAHIGKIVSAETRAAQRAAWVLRRARGQVHQHTPESKAAISAGWASRRRHKAEAQFDIYELLGAHNADAI